MGGGREWSVRLWQDWIMVVAMGTESPGGGEARKDVLTVFGTDQMRGLGIESKFKVSGLDDWEKVTP